MNDWMDFLLWVRGPAFDIALVVFVVGILLRLFEILLLGRSPQLAQPKAAELTYGLRTVVSRQLTDRGTFRRAPLVVILGYLWHIGFLVALLLFVPLGDSVSAGDTARVSSADGVEIVYTAHGGGDPRRAPRAGLETVGAQIRRNGTRPSVTSHSFLSE